MPIKKISRIIYKPRYLNEHTRITVKTQDNGVILWQGEAKNLRKQTFLSYWDVEEILNDPSDNVIGKILIVT